MTTHSTKGATLFQEATLKKSAVKRVCCKEMLRWVTYYKVSKQRVSEDEAHWKGLWWYMGPLDDP